MLMIKSFLFYFGHAYSNTHKDWNKKTEELKLMEWIPQILCNFLSMWIVDMRLDVYYFGCDFSDCCPYLYEMCMLKYNVLAAVSWHLKRLEDTASETLFQLATIKIRTTVQKITTKIISFSQYFVTYRLYHF